MIARRAANGEELQPAARVARRVGEHGLEDVAAHVIGARAREQHAARREDPHRSEIDLLVARDGAEQCRLGLGEGGRVEHDGIKSVFALFQLPQQIEGVRLPPSDVPDAVEPSVLRSARQRLGTLIHRDHFGGGPGEVQRE